MEKDFLQSLKLDISKRFTLVPYERIAFHKILGIKKSESGMRILIRDMYKGGIIRKSAISVLSSFNSQEVTDAFTDFIVRENDIAADELSEMLDRVSQSGKETHARKFIALIKDKLDKTEYIDKACRIVFAVGRIGSNDPAVAKFLVDIMNNVSANERLRVTAIETFMGTIDIVQMEDLLREGNDRISCAVYRALAQGADRIIASYEVTGDDLFTATPGADDRSLLDIRVLLGKMSPHFDSYSRETKSVYILAMILCGHREFIVYTLKALTSNDAVLIDLTLYVILANTGKLRTPDKLMRSLIALPSVTDRDSHIVIEIFCSFFSSLRENRTNMLFRDKIYNYIVVTLDAYFESYRKNFMIPEIMERDYLPEVQGVRKFVANRLSPDLKRKIITYLTSDDTSVLKKILGEISESITYISSDEDEIFVQFLEMLFENDIKAREISASRIRDIDYEKRYLRNRIVRLCDIIGRLNIDDASANLVKIFNYVKKYKDAELYNAVTKTLSHLNYPYMLGELEVLLLSGDDAEQKRAVKLLPLYSDQRSLNILIDYIRDHPAADTDIAFVVLSTVARREIGSNVAAREIALKVIETAKKPEIKKVAIQMLGQCGFEEDIAYLTEIFSKSEDNIVKEAIIQAYDFIMQNGRDFDRHRMISLLKECLKDPGIRIRIFACTILLRLGEKEALGTIRDMMVIKNRNIQREIMMVMGNSINLEIAFFLMSLLKEDYAISVDIVPIFRYLQPTDVEEVDHFIVNLFKKFEGASYDSANAVISPTPVKTDELKNFKTNTVTVLLIDLSNFDKYYETYSPIEMSMVFKPALVRLVECIVSRNGTITRGTAGLIIAYFPEVVSAANAAYEISRISKEFNDSIEPEHQIQMDVFISLSEVDMVNGELIFPEMREYRMLPEASIPGRVFLTGDAARLAGYSFTCSLLPSTLFRPNGSQIEYRELISPNNFLMKAEAVIAKLQEQVSQKEEELRQIEIGIKANEPQGKKTKNTIAFAAAMDTVGRSLRKDLMDISKYVGKRSTDRELIKNVEKMVDDAYRHYSLEVTKTVIE